MVLNYFWQILRFWFKAVRSRSWTHYDRWREFEGHRSILLATADWNCRAGKLWWGAYFFLIIQKQFIVCLSSLFVIAHVRVWNFACWMIILFQEPILFSTTIRENILYGAEKPEEITEAQVVLDASLTRFYLFISEVVFFSSRHMVISKRIKVSNILFLLSSIVNSFRLRKQQHNLMR